MKQVMCLFAEFTGEQRAVQFEQVGAPIANRRGVLQSDLARLRRAARRKRSVFARLLQRLGRGDRQLAPKVDVAPSARETRVTR
jgi:hypothetical protein